jgi:DNA sulfur modification protein DndD
LILDAITLTNFGIYKGEHTVELSPKKNKPIILFGAYNGSGKTTLLEALQLVLFGKNALTNGRGKLAYDDYLKSLINRDVNQQHGTGLSLNFRTKSDGQDIFFKITRTWSVPTNNIKESFEVIRNNQYDPISSERWYEFVEEIMPSQISELFFFDGEKLEGLADPIKSASLLRAGIYSLLGIHSIDNLIKSLSQLEKKKTLETASKTQNLEVGNFENQLKALILEEEHLYLELGSENTKLDILNNKISQINNNLKMAGFDLYENRHQLEKDLLLSEQANLNLYDNLLALTEGVTPLLIIEELMEELREECQKSSGHNSRSFNMVKEEFSLLLNILKNNKQANEPTINILENEIKNRLNTINNELNKTAIDINIDEIPNKNELCEVRDIIKIKLNETKSLKSKIELINKELQAVPSEENVKVILDQLKDTEKDTLKINFKIEDNQEKIKILQSQKFEIEKVITKQLEEINTQNISSKINIRVIEHIKRSKSTLEFFKIELIKSNIESLSNEITLCFQQLHRKSKFNLKFEINSENFSLNIIKPNIGLFSANKLSAGERQLLAVSVLWALAKCSGKNLPTIIDTPLGRLDGPHREKIIKSYFPKASEQVIIFSTDEEVTLPLYKSLKPHIAAEYKINYSEETESSTFEKGYF